MFLQGANAKCRESATVCHLDQYSTFSVICVKKVAVMEDVVCAGGIKSRVKFLGYGTQSKWLVK